MEAMVLDVVGGVLLRVHHHVFSCSVQHMGHLVRNSLDLYFERPTVKILKKQTGHPNVLKVGDVADRLPIADDDPVEDLGS